MKKILLAISLISVLLITGCNNNENIVNNNQQGEEKQIVEENNIESTENNKETSNIDFLDVIYGVYGNEYGKKVSVFPGKDDNHINIDYSEYRAEAFAIDDIVITRENDSIKGSKVISSTDVYDDLKNAKMDLTIKNESIQLVFDKNVLIFGDKTKNTIIEEKNDGIPVITEQEKQKALSVIEESNGNTIDNKVFEIIKDSNNYLVLRVKCYVYNEPHDDPTYAYYQIEGSESVGMSKYYNFDKKNSKFVSLSDLINASKEEVNDYIKTAIENKKNGWIDGTDKQWNTDDFSTKEIDWPYFQDFVEIGNPDYFENYFLIDEENKVVRIRCLSYPDEAEKALGDICIDVPFSMFESLSIVN